MELLQRMVIHARNMNKGQRNGKSSDKTDPEIKNNPKILDLEEVDTSKAENKLRKENNITPRILP